jgi:glycerol-3-phosphate dehydrogenase
MKLRNEYQHVIENATRVGHKAPGTFEETCSMPTETLKTKVLIIGGGATGTGLARDLALRGIPSILVERKDINAGASGANHGLLHSGGRYAASDPETARECREEGDLLKQLAPHCVEDTGGLFVAIEGDDENYIADFPQHCQKSGLPVKAVDPAEAIEMEPALSHRLIAAYHVQDGAIDPFKLSLENVAQANSLGSTLLCHTRVAGFERIGGRIKAVHLFQESRQREVTVEAEQVVNATGVWAREVAEMAGLAIDLVYSKGSLVITDERLTQGVINRLRPATDGDILVPGGTVSLLGTTSIRLDRLEDIRPTVVEVNAIIDQGAEMLPILKSTRYIRAYAGVRPLVSNPSSGDDREVSRGFTLIDHSRDGVENFTTITGGKLSTYRIMAERTADVVSQKLGISAPCKTRSEPLPDTVHGRWTEPGKAPREWIKKHDTEDILLCECEMVPTSTVDQVIDAVRGQNNKADLKAIGLRSRIGKGTCQGAFCGVRILAHMYDRDLLQSTRGLEDLQQFLNGRWRGIRPVLWDMGLVQEELQEALHCGLFGLEQTPADGSGDLT